MFNALRTRFGAPGIVAVIALVFAMFGGAYAATDNNGVNATASAKAKKGPRGPKGPKGDTGPVGPQGPAGAKGDTGAAGANGKDGANGTNGTNGTNGKSAETATFAGAKGSCTEGGIEVKSATPTVLVCNGVKGADGTTGFTATLPSGETETGYWGGKAAPAGTESASPLSFPIPLAAQLASGSEFIVPNGGSDLNCDDGVNPPPSVENPEAAPGKLCVFNGPIGTALSFAGVISLSGRLLIFETGFQGLASGTWALTAP